MHHLLVSHQERIFEPRFIHDSYACRTGKGTLAASDRLMTFLRQITANGRRPAWALKLDVANFFPSIHKATLAVILARHLSHPELRWLTRPLRSGRRCTTATPSACRAASGSPPRLAPRAPLALVMGRDQLPSVSLKPLTLR